MLIVALCVTCDHFLTTCGVCGTLLVSSCFSTFSEARKVTVSNLDSQIALASQSIAQIRHKTKGPMDYASRIPHIMKKEFKIPRRRRRRKHLLQSETRSFSISIANFPTHLLCLMQANSSGVEFLRTISKFKAGERVKILSSFVHVYPKMWNLVILRRSRTVTAK